MVVSIVVIATRVRKFAVAYFREDLKAMDCNPDIYAQQNPRTKITHTKQNMLKSV